jgi:hypothetical protein
MAGVLRVPALALRACEREARLLELQAERIMIVKGTYL